MTSTEDSLLTSSLPGLISVGEGDLVERRDADTLLTPSPNILFVYDERVHISCGKECVGGAN